MRRQIAKMPIHLTFTATQMLGSKLFSAPFKVGDVLKWPELLSGDMFLSQLQQEPVVTRHMPAAPEMDGMSSGCSSRSPVSSSNVLQLYGKSLGSRVHDQARGSQKGLPVVVSVLPWLLIFYLGKIFQCHFLQVIFILQKYSSKPPSGSRQALNRVVNYFTSQMAAYNSESLFGLSIFIKNGLNFAVSSTMMAQKT